MAFLSFLAIMYMIYYLYCWISDKRENPKATQPGWAKCLLYISYVVVFSTFMVGILMLFTLIGSYVAVPGY